MNPVILPMIPFWLDCLGARRVTAASAADPAGWSRRSGADQLFCGCDPRFLCGHLAECTLVFVREYFDEFAAIRVPVVEDAQGDRRCGIAKMAVDQVAQYNFVGLAQVQQSPLAFRSKPGFGRGLFAGDRDALERDHRRVASA